MGKLNDYKQAQAKARQELADNKAAYLAEKGIVKKNRYGVVRSDLDGCDSIYEKTVKDNLQRLLDKGFILDFNHHCEKFYYRTGTQGDKKGYEDCIWPSTIKQLTHEQIREEYTSHLYQPDFWVKTKHREIYIETKGYFQSKDRTKMKIIKDLYPEYQFVMLFQKNLTQKDMRGKTLLDWGHINDFESYVGQLIPQELLNKR